MTTTKEQTIEALMDDHVDDFLFDLQVAKEECNKCTWDEWGPINTVMRKYWEMAYDAGYEAGKKANDD